MLRLAIAHAQRLRVVISRCASTWQGQPCLNFPRPDWLFDMHAFMDLQLATCPMSDGQILSDDPCLQDASCTWLRPLPEDGRSCA